MHKKISLAIVLKIIRNDEYIFFAGSCDIIIGARKANSTLVEIDKLYEYSAPDIGEG